ncbi:hypothetical protein [Marimonas lutisalis]|uniref:hypothetical protein n=1 Tax=Marimonas lutisalis TaxID=2545756 RepID=UPI0013761628|nr:hypothetical protein [Marimonas lutisalis]
MSYVTFRFSLAKHAVGPRRLAIRDGWFGSIHGHRPKVASRSANQTLENAPR